MLAMVTSRERGFAVDDKLLQAQALFTEDSFNRLVDNMKEGKGIGGRGMTVGYGLWALNLARIKANATTEAMVSYLLKTQNRKATGPARRSARPWRNRR